MWRIFSFVENDSTIIVKNLVSVNQEKVTLWKQISLVVVYAINSQVPGDEREGITIFFKNLIG